MSKVTCQRSCEVQVYLTRRNLLSLLAKLDKNKTAPFTSFCTLVKNDKEHLMYPITGADTVIVTAVEDEDYYIDRDPGVTMEDIEAGMAERYTHQT